MDTDISPVAGNWYRHLDEGEPFQVVAVDAQGNVEIAQFDGTVDEIGAQDWRALEIEPCEAPADWSAPFDSTHPEQPGFNASDTTGGDWRAPVEEEPTLLPPQAAAVGGAPPAAGPQDAQAEIEPAGGWAESGAGVPPPPRAQSGASVPTRAELAQARDTVGELLGALDLRDYVFELRLRDGAPEVRVEHAAPDGWACATLPADPAQLRAARTDSAARARLLEAWRARLAR